MPINPNIILGIQAPKFQMADPLESAHKSLALQHLMGQQDLQAMQMKQAQLAENDDLATRDAFKAGDPDAIKSRLRSLGLYKPLQAFEKNQLDTEKLRGDIDKTKAETQVKQAQLGRDLVASANPENYAQIVEQGRALGQAWAKNAPPQFDPNWQRRNVLTADQWLKDNTKNVTAVQDGAVTRMVDTNAITNPTITGQTFSRANPGQDLVMPDATGTYKPNAPLLDAKKQIASAGASKTVVNMADGQKGFDNELKLRGDFRSEPVYKAHQEMTSAHQQITQALKQASPAGDLAGATKIMKLLDPGSVVRESELGMAMAASGMLDRLTNYATNVLNGTKLTPKQREDFQKLGDALFAESVNQYNKKRQEYTGIAGNYGLNADRVTGPEIRMPSNLSLVKKPESVQVDQNAVNAALAKYGTKAP